MRQTLRDYLDLYAYIHHSTDITLMLQDYILDNRLNREQLNKMIVLNLGEQTPYFTHTDLIKTNIENWFATHKWNIKKLCDTLDLQYNPLYDKDWYEQKTRDLDGTNTGTENTDSSFDNAIVSNDETNEVIEDKTTETKVSAYNESTYQPQQKVTENTPKDTVTDDFEKRESEEANKLLTKNLANTEDEETNIHHYGKEDSGTYAEMIEKERRQVQFNIYEWIIEHLSDEILLGVFF